MPALAPEEIRDEIFRTLMRDRGKLSTAQYPGYKGEMSVPMSAMTQRARSLQDQFTSLPAPYSGLIQSVASRNPRSFSPQKINEQLQMLGGAQGNFTQNNILGALQQQFRQNYTPYAGRFQGETVKDANMTLAEAEKGLENIGTASSTLSQKRNQTLTDALSNLQAQKQARRKTLVGNLEQFGAQQHAYGNLKNQIHKNAFDQEMAAPYQKMQMLQQAASPLNGNLDEMHPDLQKLYGMEGAAALRAYGSDPSKPMGEWGKGWGVPGGYKGELVAELPPEIAASQQVLGRMSPQFQESTYGNRKALMNNLTSQPDIGEQALAGVQGKINPFVASLEEAAKKRLKQDMAAINNKYISVNQYGSPQHIREAEDRAQEINKATLEERSRLLQNTLKEQLSLGHEGQIGDIRQLGTYGNIAQNEFGDVMGKIRGLNQRGADKWANDQAENEELYKNYQNESLWQYPHMRTQVKNEAMSDIFGDIGKRDLSLDQLYNLNTRYSELQKENQGLLAGQTELQSLRDLNDQLQRQIASLSSSSGTKKGTFGSAEVRRERAARSQAQIQAQRMQAQVEAQAAEARRQESMQAESQAQAQAHAQAAEQQRLAKIQQAEDMWTQAAKLNMTRMAPWTVLSEEIANAKQTWNTPERALAAAEELVRTPRRKTGNSGGSRGGKS